MSCVDCHDPHGSVLPRSLQTFAANDRGCFRCHGDKRGPFTFEHAPMKLEGCDACHEPHGSANPRMLVRQEVRLMCLECHSNRPVPRPTNASIGVTPPAFHDLQLSAVPQLHGLPHEGARIVRQSGFSEMRTATGAHRIALRAGLAATQPPAARRRRRSADAAAAPADAKPAAAADAKPAESPAPTPPIEQNITGSIDFGYRWRQRRGRQLRLLPQRRQPGRRPQALRLGLQHPGPQEATTSTASIPRVSAGAAIPAPRRASHARKMGVYDLTRRLPQHRLLQLPALLRRSADEYPAQASSWTRIRSTSAAACSICNSTCGPASASSPYFDFNRNWNSGHGITDLRQTNANDVSGGHPVATTPPTPIRGGVRIEMNKWHLTLEQGGVNYGENRPGHQLQPQPGQLCRRRFSGQTAFPGQRSIRTTASAAAPSTVRCWPPRIRSPGWICTASSSTASRRTTSHYTESATGQFVNLSNLLFYTGQTDLVNAAARQPHTSGSGGRRDPAVQAAADHRIVVDRPAARLRLRYVASTLSGTSVVALASTAPALAQRLVRNYSQQEVDVMYDLGSHLTLRGGYRYVWGDSLRARRPSSPSPARSKTCS